MWLGIRFLLRHNAARCVPETSNRFPILNQGLYVWPPLIYHRGRHFAICTVIPVECDASLRLAIRQVTCTKLALSLLIQLKIGLRLDDPVANGVTNHVAESIEPQLAHDRRAVGFPGLDTDSEEPRNILVAFSLDQKLQDFPFPSREKAGCLLPSASATTLFQVTRKNYLGNPGSKKGAVL